jgi:hypothetical protein
MLGCIALGVFALGAVGGMTGLVDALQTRFPEIGGLVLGQRGKGAIAVVAAAILTWYLVSATRPPVRTETGVVY